MDIEKHWPYIAGAGLLLVLLILARSGSSGSTEYHSIAALPDPGGDALLLQKEQDKTGIIGALINAGAALQGNRDSFSGQTGLIDAQGNADVARISAQYGGEATLAGIAASRDRYLSDSAGRTQVAIGTLAANRDIRLGEIGSDTQKYGYDSAVKITDSNNTAQTTQTGITAGAATTIGVAQANAGIKVAQTNADAQRDTASTYVRGNNQRGIIDGVTSIIKTGLAIFGL